MASAEGADVSSGSRRFAQLAIAGLMAMSLASPAIGAGQRISVRSSGAATDPSISGLFVDLDSPDTIDPKVAFGDGILKNYAPADSSFQVAWVQNQFDYNQLTAINFVATNTSTGHYWQFYFYPQIGQTLSVGTYTGVGAQPTATSAGLQMFSTDPACTTFAPDSSFRIDEIASAGDGTLSAFAATVSVRCDATAPLWLYDLRYQSSVGFVASRLGPPSAQNERTQMYLALGGTDVGSVVTDSFGIENSGSENLTLGVLSLSGPDSSYYTVVDDACSGHSISVGSSCTITLRAVVPERAYLEGAITIPANTSRGAIYVAFAAEVSYHVTRDSGADRYAMAASLSSVHFAPGVNTAFIATGTNFPDALSGGPVAARLGGPILLVNSAIPAVTATELTRLKPGHIVIFGGPGSVSNAIQTALATYTTGSVTREYGADRYAASASISAHHFSPGVSVAFIATGLNFPDALAGGPAAAKHGGPILLVSSGIPISIAAELKRLKPKSIVVLGGTGSVSDAIKRALASYTIGTVTRESGADRYAAAAAMSAANFAPHYSKRGAWGMEVVFIATGRNYPDALAGGPVAGGLSVPILLVSNVIPSSTDAELRRLIPAQIVVLGGPGSVSGPVLAALEKYVP